MKKPPLVNPFALHSLRVMLVRRYWYLTLKFSHPIISESGHWEASWNGGKAAADTEIKLITAVLELLEDCGSGGHLWETTGEKRDPANSDNVVITQRLVCAVCDVRDRMITVYQPYTTVTGH